MIKWIGVEIPGAEVIPGEKFYTLSIPWKSLALFRRNQWIYRGHSQTDWSLRTALERACEALGDKALKTAEERERQLLREFKRRYHHYSKDRPIDGEILEWLSLMQHHGAPTRLLDCTYSILVAAYFAFEQAKGDCCVWGINASWTYQQSVRIFPEKSKFLSEMITESSGTDFPETFMRENPRRFICAFSPFRLNERMVAQKGVFLVPGDVSASFENNLVALEGHERPENVVKLLLRHDDRKRAIEDLYNVPVTRAVLYPGLDGFAYSLRLYQPQLDALPPAEGDTR